MKAQGKIDTGIYKNLSALYVSAVRAFIGELSVR